MLRRRIVSSLAATALLVGGGALSPAFASVQTSQENVGDILGAPAAVEKSANERIAAWQKLQFGLFMHWGVYSMFGGSYKGQVQSIGYPEQIKAWMNIPREEYLKEAKKMTADKWDAAKICQTAKNAGMKYVMVTSKHHDGFAMWDTKTTDYNVVKQTAFGKDPMKQLADECGKIDMKLAFYFSIIDWEKHDPEPYSNTNPITEEHLQYNLDQITELLTNYGPIAEFWFDMGGPTATQSQKMADKVHELQPNTTVVNSRVWNNKGDFNVGGDNAVHSSFSIGPWESIRSIFPRCWSYCSDSRANRSAGTANRAISETISNLVGVVANDGNFAFNVGPMGDGSLPEYDEYVLKELGTWHTDHPHAIDGASATWIPAPSNALLTVNGSDLYIFPKQWNPGESITVRGLANNVTSVTVDGKGTPVQFARNGLDLTVTMSGESPDKYRPVIKVALDGEARYVPTQTVNLDHGSGTVPMRDIVRRTVGTSYNAAILDAYIVDRSGEKYGDVEFDLTQSSGFQDDVDYSVTFNGVTHLFKGIELKTGPISGYTMNPNEVSRLRIQLAKPSYYTDALNVNVESIKVAAYKDHAASVAPTFKSQPSDAQVVEGESVTFAASASGRPAPTYQWYRIGADGEDILIEGATKSSYTFVTTKDDNEADFFVVATNEAGTAESEIATLTVVDPSLNVALKKPARQSSDSAWNGPASRAVDGNTDGKWDNGSVSATATQNDPWWEVDLEQTVPVGLVNIYNRSADDQCNGRQSCADRLKGFYVIASKDKLDDKLSTEEIEKKGEAGELKYFKVEEKADFPTSLNFDGYQARYIRVMLPGQWKELNLAEVEVYKQNTAPTAVISAVADPEEGFSVSGDQLNAVPGSILTFTAETTGFPVPTLQWQTSPDGQTWNDVEGQTQQGYSFEIGAQHHGVKVRVAATNSVKTAYSEPLTINVVEKPVLTPLSASLNDSVLEPADDGAWQKVTVNEGETVVLSTTASGMPAPTIAWQSREVSGDEDSWTPIEGETTEKLSLTASKEVQSHLYRAVATNSQGEAVTAPLRVVLHQQAPTPNPGGGEPGQTDVPTLELGAAQVKVGDTLSILVKGLKKGERIELTVHSEPVVIPEGDIKYDDEKGTAQADWKVPAGFEVGEHTVKMVSKAGERAIKFEVLPADVVPVPDQSNADKPVGDSQPVKKASVKKLSSTGSDAVLLSELSALFLATGVAGFAARRRVRD